MTTDYLLHVLLYSGEKKKKHLLEYSKKTKIKSYNWEEHWGKWSVANLWLASLCFPSNPPPTFLWCKQPCHCCWHDKQHFIISKLVHLDLDCWMTIITLASFFFFFYTWVTLTGGNHSETWRQNCHSPVVEADGPLPNSYWRVKGNCSLWNFYFTVIYVLVAHEIIPQNDSDTHFFSVNVKIMPGFTAGSLSPISF